MRGLSWALGVLHRAGRIQSPQVDGMRMVIEGDPVRGTVGWRACWDGWRLESGESESSEPEPGAEPDVDDAATVGCLAALGREASGNPRLNCSFVTTAAAWVCFVEPAVESYFSEGHAWKRALIAMAEREVSAEAYKQTWLLTLQNLVSSLGLDWIPPHAGRSPRGETVFEWQNGPRALTVYVGDSKAFYVRSWGKSVIQEMEDGWIMTDDKMQAVWQWLHATGA